MDSSGLVLDNFGTLSKATINPKMSFMTTSTQLTISVVAAILAGPFEGTYPPSTVAQLQRSLETNLYQTHRRGSFTLTPFIFDPSSPPTSIYSAGKKYGVDWAFWRNALLEALSGSLFGADLCLSVQEALRARSVSTLRNPQPSFECRIMDMSTQHDSGQLYPLILDDSGGKGPAEGNSKLRTTSMLPKLADMLERARERSQEVSDAPTSPQSMSTCRSRIIMPSTTSSRVSAAEPPPQALHNVIVAMDIESNVVFPMFLSSPKSRTRSSGSAPPSMYSAPSNGSSSSSSAQSSPLCITPELPPVLLPVLSQSLPTGGISDALLPNRYPKTSRASSGTQVGRGVSAVESLVACRTLDHNTPIDTKLTVADNHHNHRLRLTCTTPSSPSSSSSPEVFPPVTTNPYCRPGSDHLPPPAYLSRSQRRLARTVTKPSCHDIQQYIYQGGQTGVVSGGVMLGPKTVVPGKDVQSQKKALKGQNRNQHQNQYHQQWESKKTSGDNMPKSKEKGDTVS